MDRSQTARISPEDALDILNAAYAYYEPEALPIVDEAPKSPLEPWVDYYDAAA